MQLLAAILCLVLANGLQSDGTKILSRRVVSSALVVFPTNFWALNLVLELHSIYTNIRCLMICVIG